MNYLDKSYFVPFVCKIHSAPSAAAPDPGRPTGIASRGMRNIVQSQHQMSLHLDLGGKCKVL